MKPLKNHNGLSYEGYLEVARLLREYRNNIADLIVKISPVFPSKGEWARPIEHLIEALNEIDLADAYFEENFFAQHPESGLGDYYPGKKYRK